MKQTPSQINKRIAMYRSLAGYTQETAAQALNMKKNTYARMERYGNPKPDMLKRLSELYGVKVDILLYGEEPLFPLKNIPEEPLMVLHDHTTPFFVEDPPITLTVNEKNCVKLCRNLSKEKRDELLKMINEFCKDNS